MFRHALALMLLAAATISPAQDVNDQDYKLGVTVELVQLPVSVLDKKGLPVRGLQPEHFAVYEDKVLQNISLFKQEDIPLSVGLVIDGSSSMYDKRDRLNVAAMTFVHESNPEDETAVLSFGDVVNLLRVACGTQRLLVEQTGSGFVPARELLAGLRQQFLHGVEADFHAGVVQHAVEHLIRRGRICSRH